MWRPVRSALAEHPSVAWDFRGHGASFSSRDRHSWWEMAEDAVAVRASVGSSPVVGVGHSMGGAALVMAALLVPGSFEALVLCEPILFGGPYHRSVDHPLVGLARRRREVFESRDAVRSSYSAKPPFAAWNPAALDGYLAGGFVEDAAGTRLACRPAVEADVFAASSVHAAWERLGEVRIPVTILFGAETDTYGEGHAQSLAARFPQASAVEIAGTGHFLPMERPDVVAAAVRDHLLS